MGSRSIPPVVAGTIAVSIPMTNIVSAVGLTPINVTVKYKNPVVQSKKEPTSDISARLHRYTTSAIKSLSL